jgi:hypothetical protein
MSMRLNCSLSGCKLCMLTVVLSAIENFDSDYRIHVDLENRASPNACDKPVRARILSRMTVAVDIGRPDGRSCAHDEQAADQSQLIDENLNSSPALGIRTRVQPLSRSL